MIKVSSREGAPISFTIIQKFNFVMPCLSKVVFDYHFVKLYHTIIRQISVCLFFLPVCLKFDFQENPSHGELQTRLMCGSEPDDVQYDLSLYGCGQIIEF